MTSTIWIRLAAKIVQLLNNHEIIILLAWPHYNACALLSRCLKAAACSMDCSFICGNLGSWWQYYVAGILCCDCSATCACTAQRGTALQRTLVALLGGWLIFLERS